MKTYVILLRGVMPSGKNKVPMAQLRQVLTDDGFGNVRTWIQSGNVILQSTLPAGELQEWVHQLIKQRIGPDLAVVVRTGVQLRQVLEENHFREGYDISRVFFVSFGAPPPGEKVKALLAQDFSLKNSSLPALPLICTFRESTGKANSATTFWKRSSGFPQRCETSIPWPS